MNAATESHRAVARAPADLHAVLGSASEALWARRGDAVAVQEADSGCFVHVGGAWSRLLGIEASVALGRAAMDLFPAPLGVALRAAEQAAAAHDGPLASDHRIDLAGERREITVWRHVGEPDPTGSRWLVSVWSDRSAERQRETQLKQAFEQLEQLQRSHEVLRRDLAEHALRDPASGLSTRANFEEQLRREVDLSTREHREFALVFAELDPPTEKVLAAGDAGARAILAAMGRLLRGGTRAMDASCRLDERRFAVLLSGVGLATAHSRMEGLRRRCATEIVVHEGQEVGFTVAMGVASFPHTAQSQTDLVGACDAALAEARRRGGNHVTLAAIRFEAG